MMLRYREWIAAAAGAATTLAFAPHGFYILAVLGPALLFLLWEFASPRDAARTGFFFGAALFGAGTWWIYTAIHDFGQAPAWLALILLGGLLAIKGAYYALLGYVVARIAPDPSAPRSLLLIPAAWTLLEWLRGWLFTGFPWLELGYAHSDSPLAALTTIGGIHLVTIANVATAGALIVVFRHAGGARLAAIALAVVFWLGGYLITGREWTKATRRADPDRAAPGRDSAGRKMARRESREDARDLSRVEPPGARRAHHRLAGVRGSRARARGGGLPRIDPARIARKRIGRDDRPAALRFRKRGDPQRPLFDERGGRRLVLQAPPRSFRRILSRAGKRAQLDAAEQPAVLRHDAGR